MSVVYEGIFIIGTPIIKYKKVEKVKRFDELDGSPFMKEITKDIYIIEGTDIEIEDDIVFDTVTVGELGSITTGGYEQYFIGMYVAIVGGDYNPQYSFIDDTEDKIRQTKEYLKDTFNYTGEVYSILTQYCG